MDDPNRVYPIRIYGGKATRLGQPPSIEEAVSKIHALVDTGHPLFTKEVLRDVGRQLRNARNKEAQKISVKGLDGVVVEFDIETGDTHKSWEPGFEFIVYVLSLLPSLWNLCYVTTIDQITQSLANEAWDLLSTTSP